MGQFLSMLKTFLARLGSFPLQRKPISFNLQENFTSTGEELEDDWMYQEDPYTKLQSRFIAKLNEARQATIKQKSSQMAVNYPGWDDLTIEYLHNVFMFYLPKGQYMLTFSDTSLFLDHLGDNTPKKIRMEKFNAVDSNGDTWLEFEEFLNFIYTFNVSTFPSIRLQGLAKKCYDKAQKIRFVNSLSVGEQLQSGLF